MFGKLFKKNNFAKLIEDGAIILDVRSPDEFAAGSAKDSINIPLGELPHNIISLKAKNVPVICVCAVGVRAASAKSKLSNEGIEAYNGISWNKMSQIVGKK